MPLTAETCQICVSVSNSIVRKIHILKCIHVTSKEKILRCRSVKSYYRSGKQYAFFKRKGVPIQTVGLILCLDEVAEHGCQ